MTCDQTNDEWSSHFAKAPFLAATAVMAALLPADQWAVEAARAGGVEISALALPQCCLSAAIAEVVREAGATQVTVAARPDENALFEALRRALPARLA